MKIKEIIAQFKQHKNVLIKTFLISFVLVSVIIVGYAKFNPYLHEFGHSATAIAFALTYHNPSLNITWICAN